MKRDRLNRLIDGYWSATLSPSEEQELRKTIATIEGGDEQLEALKVMMGGFDELSVEHETKETVTTRPARAKIIRLVASFSAVAAMLAIVFITLLTTEDKPQAEIYCYINGEPITDIEIALEQTKYFDQVKSLAQTIDKFESILN